MPPLATDSSKELPLVEERSSSICAGAVGEVYKFCADSAMYPKRRLRQATVAADGLLIGGIKTAQKDFFTWQTAEKVTVNTLLGLGIGAALATKHPVAVGTALLFGGFCLGAGTVSTWNRLSNDKELGKAMDAVWKYGDPKTMAASMRAAESHLGPEAFDLGLATTFGLGGGAVGKLGTQAIGGRLGWFKTTAAERSATPVPNESRTAGVDTLASGGTLKFAEYDCGCKVNPQFNPPLGVFCAEDFAGNALEQQAIGTVMQEGNKIIPGGIKLTAVRRTDRDALLIDVDTVSGIDITDEEGIALWRIGRKLSKQHKGKWIEVTIPDERLGPEFD